MLVSLIIPKFPCRDYAHPAAWIESNAIVCPLLTSLAVGALFCEWAQTGIAMPDWGMVPLAFGLLCRCLDRVLAERQWRTWIQRVGHWYRAKGIHSALLLGRPGLANIMQVPCVVCGHPVSRMECDAIMCRLLSLLAAGTCVLWVNALQNGHARLEYVAIGFRGAA